MSTGGARLQLAILGFLTISLRTAVPQSVNASPRAEKKDAAAPFDGEKQRANQPVRIGNGFYLQRSPNENGTPAAGIVERTATGSKFYPLPQSSAADYRRLRAADNRYRLPPMQTAKDYERREVIGPYQIEGSCLWFGNHYYDGEGQTGVGAFGYFDMETRRYVLFSPPEVARWEISALLVEPDAVWLGLDHSGEDISETPGGFARWDRNRQQLQHYPLEFVVDGIRRDKTDTSTLVLTTRGGYALFRKGDVQRFRVQKGANGKRSAICIRRFPAPPSIQ